MLFNTKNTYLFLLIIPISIYTADFFDTDNENFNYSLQQELTLPTSFRAPHEDSDLDEYSSLPELFPNLPTVIHDENTPPTTAIFHSAHLLRSISRKHERTESENDEPYNAQPLDFLTQKHKKHRTQHQQTINPDNNFIDQYETDALADLFFNEHTESENDEPYNAQSLSFHTQKHKQHRIQDQRVINTDNNFIDQYETDLLPDLFFNEREQMPILHAYPTEPVDTEEAEDSAQTASGSNLICHAYLCNESFSNKNDFHTHLKEKHSIRENHTPKMLRLICESPKEIIRLACNYPECKITCTTKNIHHFKTHLISHSKNRTQKPKQLRVQNRKKKSESLSNETGERILCKAHECNTSFKNAKELHMHLAEKHSKNHLYRCNYPDCEKKYSIDHVGHFKDHLLSHSKELPQCPKCKKTFARERYAQKHMREKHPEIYNTPNCEAAVISYQSESTALS